MQFFTVKRRNTVKGREKQPLVKSMFYQMHYLAFVLFLILVVIPSPTF